MVGAVSVDQFFVGRSNAATVTIHLLEPKEAKAFLDGRKTYARWAEVHGFKPKAGRSIELPARDGGLGAVLLVRGDDADPFVYARLPSKLPKGRYQVDGCDDPAHLEAMALGWCFAQYQLTKYRNRRRTARKLVWPKALDKNRVRQIGDATFLVRDLVNIPAEDMGPDGLEATARELAGKHDAQLEVISGDALLEAGYPAVHAVGRAGPVAPRLIDLKWGPEDAPKVTLVGKGVCFDTGGLDLKSADGMILMKKDMGGAAHVLALADLVMGQRLPVRLRVLVPAVENSIGPTAMRPSDILQTRKGLTVEVGNTDAEGRLILADALAEAVSEKPDVLIDYATLTGAARVALGTDVPAMFSTDDELAQGLLEGSARAFDPIWRMPLVDDYDRYLEGSISDIKNVGGGRYGGAITAALFLRRFVGKTQAWAHFDLMAYNRENRAGRPKGGEAMGLRAALAMLEARFVATEPEKAEAAKKSATKKSATKKSAAKKSAAKKAEPKGKKKKKRKKKKRKKS
jgi:leucyl aminopeptidase